MNQRKVILLWIVMVVGLTLSCRKEAKKEALKEISKKIGHTPEDSEILKVHDSLKGPSPDDFIPVDKSPKAVTYDHEKVASEIARWVGVEGDVVVKALVDTKGAVIETEIQESSGNEILDREAMWLVKEMKFRVALAREKRESVWILCPVKFRFNESEGHEDE